MALRKSRLLISNVVALSLLVLLIVQGGGGIKPARADVDAWSIETSPNPGTTNNYLYGVSLADSSNVWAVGSYLDGSMRTLALKWDGSSWSHEDTPNPVLGSNELRGVHARTSTDVWTVGNSTGPSNPRPIILRNTGSGWSSVTVPYTGTHSMYLRGVSAVSSNLAWAVGFDGSSPLIYKWNGTSWSFDTVPNITAQLHAVSAVSSTDAWAVGSTGSGNTGDTVILRWNGTQWSQVTSPNPGTANNGLSGVKAVSSSLAYAVGYYDSGSGARTLALKWDNSSGTWSQETSANPDTTDMLEAVDVGGTQTWAVGESRTSPFRTLTLRRTTSGWTAVTSPNNNSNNHVLYGVAVDPDITGCQGGDIWAVGHYYTGSAYNTLIMQYTVSAPCR